MPTPVIIVTGFLGCGKTSFLRHLLPLCGEAGVRPALIINEVGDVDVDGELLADLHAEQARLVGGCVCCTLQARLAETLDTLLDQGTSDVIIIECSGVSNPMDVLGVLSAPALLRRLAVSHVVCLLDAVRFPKIINVTDLVKTQAATADVLILNKADRLTDEQRAPLEALAAEINPHAQRYLASYGDIGAEALRQLLIDRTPMHAPCSCGHDHHHGHAYDCHDHALPASFCTVALPLPESMERAVLESLLHALPTNVIRVKGFAHLAGEGWYVLQRVYDTIDLYPLNAPPPSIGALLVCIGQQMDPEEIKGLVEEYVGESTTSGRINL